MKIFLALLISTFIFVVVQPLQAFWSPGMEVESLRDWSQSDQFQNPEDLYPDQFVRVLKVMKKSPIRIPPGTDIQSLVDANPMGSTFVLQSGIHRHQQIRPRNGNKFFGEQGAILSGAKVLNNFVKEGKYWVAYDQHQQGPVQGFCALESTDIPLGGCKFPEDLFIDDVPLAQAVRFLDLRSGTWLFDYDANKIYLADNPTNRKVETSVTRYAFVGPANDVTIWGLIIEKYANAASEGAIHAKNGAVGPLGKNWIIRNNEIRFNHACGIRVSPGMKVIANRIHHNGQLGLGGGGSDMLFEYNEISHNNIQGFRWIVEGGGAKILKSTNVVFTNNFVHDNIGPGLWADVDNFNFTYSDNWITDNAGPGIFHEKSFSAIIKNNQIERNGFGFPNWLVGGGIVISASMNVDVFGNTVRYNADGIGIVKATTEIGRFGPYDVGDIFVHDNDITMGQGHTGMDILSQDPIYFTGRNIRFERNNFFLVGDNKRPFWWMNKLRTESEWQTFGQDVNGAITKTHPKRQ